MIQHVWSFGDLLQVVCGIPCLISRVSGAFGALKLPILLVIVFVSQAIWVCNSGDRSVNARSFFLKHLNYIIIYYIICKSHQMSNHVSFSKNEGHIKKSICFCDTSLPMLLGAGSRPLSLPLHWMIGRHPCVSQNLPQFHRMWSKCVIFLHPRQ